MSVNRAVLVGRLTRDPELKYTPQGTAVATFGLAVSRTTKNQQGDYEVDFFNIVAWEARATFASNYLKKGRLVAVDGRIQTRKYVDQSGQQRTSFEIVAERLEGLGPREDVGPEGDSGESRSAPPAGQRPAAASRPAAKSTPLPEEDIDESDPFADE